MPAGFVVNPDSSVPIFRQIVDGLRASIARGALATGDLLPSTRALSEELGVNPNTVQKAFTELEREGLVSAERGRGMVVRDGTRASARSTGEEAVLGRLVEAMRLARAVELDSARLDALVKRARKLAGQERKGEST